MPFGAQPQGDGRVRFSLWAPGQSQIQLQLDDATPQVMSADGDGWHTLVLSATAGARYRFVLPGGQTVPDPASRFQPQDVHGPSELIEPRAYGWRDGSWRGRPWHEIVLYELHVGCFTPDGTFRAAIAHLDHLVQLGVTAIELMPVSDFVGKRNWGYDGVLPFAPDASYGRPEDFKALVEAAHARGLAVLLDVVYNHFGPEGNYLSLYAPQFFNPDHHTPWGAAVNFDAAGSATVREYFIHNALYWLEEFHLDGLRFDAVHAMLDRSETPLLQEIAQRTRERHWDRPIHLLLENEHNEARWLQRDDEHRPRYYSAQWNDDVHHVLHVAASGEAEGYYADYRGNTALLARALAEGFAFQGEHMPYRNSMRGESSADLPPLAFVAFLQNHDQIGNRAFGERLTALCTPAAVRAVTALYLLLPQIPMLFMGEEWHSARPFQFFCDVGADLADAVRDGRRQEFARFKAFQSAEARARIPDPLAERTFLDSKLDWPQLRETAGAAVFDWYRQLLAIRREHITPLLPAIERGADQRVLAAGAVQLLWRAEARRLQLQANLSERPCPAPPPLGQRLWLEGGLEHGALQPWSVHWSLTT